MIASDVAATADGAAPAEVHAVGVAAEVEAVDGLSLSSMSMLVVYAAVMLVLYVAVKMLLGDAGALHPTQSARVDL